MQSVPKNCLGRLHRFEDKSHSTGSSSLTTTKSPQPVSSGQLSRQQSSALGPLPAQPTNNPIHSQESRPAGSHSSGLYNIKVKFGGKFPILPELKVPRSSYEDELGASKNAKEQPHEDIPWSSDEAAFVSPSLSKLMTLLQ